MASWRTKVLVEQRGEDLFADGVKLHFDWSSFRCHYRRISCRQRFPALDWEIARQLRISSRCYWRHTCKTCKRLFLGAPSARYCSEGTWSETPGKLWKVGESC